MPRPAFERALQEFFQSKLSGWFVKVFEIREDENVVCYTVRDKSKVWCVETDINFNLVQTLYEFIYLPSIGWPGIFSPRLRRKELYQSVIDVCDREDTTFYDIIEAVYQSDKYVKDSLIPPQFLELLVGPEYRSQVYTVMKSSKYEYAIPSLHVKKRVLA